MKKTLKMSFQTHQGWEERWQQPWRHRQPQRCPVWQQPLKQGNVSIRKWICFLKGLNADSEPIECWFRAKSGLLQFYVYNKVKEIVRLVKMWMSYIVYCQNSRPGGYKDDYLPIMNYHDICNYHDFWTMMTNIDKNVKRSFTLGSCCKLTRSHPL